MVLTLSMGPLFIFIYFLITETWKPQYRILLVNDDAGTIAEGVKINYGDLLITEMLQAASDTLSLPIIINNEAERLTGIEKVKNKNADALIIFDRSFSEDLSRCRIDSSAVPKVEFIGDLTSTNYLVSAIWVSEVISNNMIRATGNRKIPEVKETALGWSGNISEFDMVVPGILIVSLIMLMFTASIAFVSEIEHKTMMRLKLTKLTSMQFLCGISMVQLMIGVLAILLTLITALALGFEYAGSILIMVLVAALTSLSVIAFSLIIAAFTSSANEVLVVGNFPMFLFMFFTGAAFPMKSGPLFSVAGYPVNAQGLMSPTHAISALNKTLVMDMPLKNIMPEIIAILILTGVYFAIGAVIFRFRHLKLSN